MHENNVIENKRIATFEKFCNHTVTLLLQH